MHRFLVLFQMIGMLCYSIVLLYCCSLDPEAVDFFSFTAGLHSLRLASRLKLAELNALRLATA